MHRIAFLTASAGSLWLAFVSFHPGLTGPFVFDDFPNLAALGDFGSVRDGDALLRYLSNGFAGPTGRPLSLLSFLINDNDWPSDPGSFKYTNLMLHLLNGCLLFWLTFRLSRAAGKGELPAGWFGLLVSACWLLHPLNVSTVLYVVQRMALLSALFVLAGLLGYVAFRIQLADSPRRAYLGMSASVLLFTFLAVLSKENGALLPLLVLVIERSWLSRKISRKPAMAWEAVFLWLPSLALLGYLGHHAYQGYGYDIRPFTLSERLLTENVVLLDYLLHWLVPFLPSRGLFAEDYPIARGLFGSPYTLAAVAGVAALLMLAYALRRSYPSVTLALMFFFSGHLIESTTLSLEIYFEHRNYLPAMLLFLPLAQWVVDYGSKIKPAPVLAATLIAGMAFNTYRLAFVWGDETRLALSWAKTNPTSSRAQDWAADILSQHDRTDLAATLLRQAVNRIPNDIHLHIDYLVSACVSGELTRAELEQAKEKFRRVPYEFRSFPLLEGVYQNAPDETCKTLGFNELHALLDALSENPKADAPSPRSQLHQLRGILFARQGLGIKALQEFEHSFTILPDVGGGLGAVAVLATHGFYAEALKLLAEVKKQPGVKGASSANRYANLDYPREIEHLQKTIEQDLQEKRVRELSGVNHAETP